MPAALQLAMQVLSFLPAAIDAGLQVKALLDHTNEVLAKGDPTDQDWLEINAKIDALRKELHS